MNRMQNIQFMSFSCYFYFSSFLALLPMMLMRVFGCRPFGLQHRVTGIREDSHEADPLFILLKEGIGMIVIMKPQATARQTDEVMQMLITSGMQVQMNRGTQCTVLGVLGDTTQVDPDSIELLPRRRASYAGTGAL